MNILITSVGRRNYIVEYFKRTLAGRGKVIVSNSIADTSGMYAGDKAYITPLIRTDEYIPAILQICKKEDVQAVIPLFDMDLSAISAHRELFIKNGVFPVASDYQAVDLCFDKTRYADFCRMIGVATPRTYLSLKGVLEDLKNGAIGFPLVLKPRWGTGSISTEIVSDASQLEHRHDFLSKNLHRTYLDTPVPEGHVNSIVIQEHAKGVEYGMDVLNDLEGNYVRTFAKRKLAMRSGETDGAVTIHDADLELLGASISSALGHIAILDVDLIIRSDSKAYLIDMNPRFGGGYPFTHEAGVDIPAAIVSWLRGESPDGRLLEMAEGVASVKGISLYSSRTQGHPRVHD